MHALLILEKLLTLLYMLVSSYFFLEIGVGSNLYNVINGKYTLSNSCVRLKGQITECFPTKLGVKQGDVLSPNLFKLFINDLPAYMRNTDDGVSLNDIFFSTV
jgi:hypothetical protein